MDKRYLPLDLAGVGCRWASGDFCFGPPCDFLWVGSLGTFGLPVSLSTLADGAGVEPGAGSPLVPCGLLGFSFEAAAARRLASFDFWIRSWRWS